MTSRAPLSGTGFVLAADSARNARRDAPRLVASRRSEDRVVLELSPPPADGGPACLASIHLPTTTLEAPRGAGEAAMAVLSRVGGAAVVAPFEAGVELNPGDTVLVAASLPGDAGVLGAVLAAHGPALSSRSLEELVEAVLDAPGAASALAVRYAPWDEGGEGSFSAWLRADTAGAARVRDAFVLFCASRGVPGPAVHDVALALQEVLDNVVEHAYRGQPRGVVLVEARLRRGPELLVTVRDRGPAFDPLDAPLPASLASLEASRVGGLGIHLARSLVDTMRHERRGGENRLVFGKRLAPA